MAIVKLFRGLKGFYSKEKYPDVIYFAIDKKQIIVNGVEYGFDKQDPNIDLISKVELTSSNTLKFTATNDKEIIITLPIATAIAAGLMSAADKDKLDKVPDIYATKEDISWLTID